MHSMRVHVRMRVRVRVHARMEVMERGSRLRASAPLRALSVTVPVRCRLAVPTVCMCAKAVRLAPAS